MCKKLTTIITTALMFLFSNTAFAAFANYDLIRVVSDKTPGSTLEIATDLGNIDTLASYQGVKVGGSAEAFTNFIGTSSLSNLYVNYYAVNKLNSFTGILYIGTDNATAPTSPGKAGIWTTLTNINSYYNGLTTGSGNTKVANNTDTGSFGKTFGLAALGAYGGYATPFSTNASLNLASIATEPLKETVWLFENYMPPTNIRGIKKLDLYTNADGSTTINPTPIPHAAWLMGSGLMGLFGFRRKKA
ncbi:MAG: hypothetical protein WCG87_11290 [Bacteroidota bacterium]